MNDVTTDAQLLNEVDLSRTIARIANQIIEKTELDSVNTGSIVLQGIPFTGV